MRYVRQILRFIFRAALGCLIFAAVFVLGQDFIVLPSVRIGAPPKLPSKLPSQIEAFHVSTFDGEQIEVWRSAPRHSGAEAKVALIFPGNGETASSVSNLRRWTDSEQMISYMFSYRGTGRSTGWPSEQGMYRDAEAVWNYIEQREKITAGKAVFISRSLGNGPGAYLAQKLRPQVLVMISPYTNLRAVADTKWYYRWLTPFLRYSFPVKYYLSELKNTCVIIAHGRLDGLIPFSHAEELADSIRSKTEMKFIESPNAGHFDLLQLEHQKISQAIKQCSAN